ncbi:MAG: glycoside hydrolase family 125 protein, partial [Candidatus Izemoplasmatales bacterium]
MNKRLFIIIFISVLSLLLGCAQDTTQNPTLTAATTLTTTAHPTTSSVTSVPTTLAPTSEPLTTISVTTAPTTLAPTTHPTTQLETTTLPPAGVLNPGFESGSLEGWMVLSGDAFTDDAVSDATETSGGIAYQKQGDYFFGAYSVSQTGIMRSSTFTVSGSGYVSFLLGGGYHPGLTYVAIKDAQTDVELFRIANQSTLTGDGDPNLYRMSRYYVSLTAYIGQDVYFLVVDQSTQPGGFILVDDFLTHYPSIPNLASGIFAHNIRPVFSPLASTPYELPNGDFSSRTLAGWTVVGESGSFQNSHINPSFRLSNRSDEGKVGLLRSSAFIVGGEGIISFRLGATKHRDVTYLTLKKVGTNEEVFRTYSDRWRDSDEEATHLYFVDLNAYYGEALYFEIVDNSRGDWGLITLEQIQTHYLETPNVIDEIALNLAIFVDGDYTYSAMRAYVDPLIEGISDLMTKTTLRKTFYATIDGIETYKDTFPTVLEHKDNGMTFVITGDIHAMWLRDSSAQVLPYLQFMTIDADVTRMVEGLLRQQFEQIRRDPYANAFNRDGSVFERKFEIDSLCYPLWLAYEYYQITGNTQIFDYFFVMTVEKVISTLIAEQNHSDDNYRITHQTDRDISTHQFHPESKLIWSGYRPSDDVQYYRYFIPGNMFAVATMEKMAILF